MFSVDAKKRHIIYSMTSRSSIASIGGLVVKLAVAIRRSSSDIVGQPRVRFPADAFLPGLRALLFDLLLRSE